MLQNKREEIQNELAHDIKMDEENRGSEDWKKLRLKSIHSNERLIREFDTAILILKTQENTLK